MRMSPTSVPVLGVISLVAIIGSGYVFGLSSRTTAESRCASLRNQIASLERETRTNESRLGALRSQIESSAETERALRAPNARNTLLADIAQVASDHGLQIDELSAGAPVEAGDSSQEKLDDSIVSTPIRLRARGATGGVLAAIEDVHRTMAGVEVRTLSLAGDPFSNGAGTVSIEFVWYADRSE